MKFQIRTSRVGQAGKIIVQVPHGRKWVTKHVHDYEVLHPMRPGAQTRAEIAAALAAAGITPVDKLG